MCERGALNQVRALHRIVLLLLYFDLWKFSVHRGNDRGMLWLSGTPCQSITCMSGIRNRIFSRPFFHEVRFWKFLSCSSSEFGHLRRFSFWKDSARLSILTSQSTAYARPRQRAMLSPRFLSAGSFRRLTRVNMLPAQNCSAISGSLCTTSENVSVLYQRYFKGEEVLTAPLMPSSRDCAPDRRH